MNKNIIFLILLTLFTINVSAIYSGEPNSIFYINQCVGDVRVHLTSKMPIAENEYSFVGCTQNEEKNWWTCKCTNNNLNLSIFPVGLVNNVYNVVFEYNPNNGEIFNKTETISGIKVDSSKEKAKEIEVITSNLGTVSMYIIGAIFIIGLIIFFLYRSLSYSDTDKSIFDKSDEDVTFDTITTKNKELDDYLKSL